MAKVAGELKLQIPAGKANAYTSWACSWTAWFEYYGVCKAFV